MTSYHLHESVVPSEHPYRRPRPKQHGSNGNGCVRPLPPLNFPHRSVEVFFLCAFSLFISLYLYLCFSPHNPDPPLAYTTERQFEEPSTQPEATKKVDDRIANVQARPKVALLSRF